MRSRELFSYCIEVAAFVTVFLFSWTTVTSGLLVAERRVLLERGGLVSLFESAGLKANISTSAHNKFSLTERESVIWLHLHNFGGTLVCEEASRQGEVTSGKDQNCNWPGDGCSTPPSDRVYCGPRARKEKGYTFTMLERGVDEEDFCDNALYGTMLRDPIAGLSSTLRQNHFHKDEILAILRSGNDALPARHLPCLPPGDTYHHFDNFATRSLSQAYFAPPLGVTAEHLQAAKSNLARMDVVLILEELDKHVKQLSEVFGWDLQIETSHKSNEFHGSSTSPQWTDEEIEFLRKVNELDYELYTFGQELAQNISNKVVPDIGR